MKGKNLKKDSDPSKSLRQLMWLNENGLDLTAPEIVEVLINKVTRVIHVNVDGTCVLRICRIQGDICLGVTDWTTNKEE
ncbi:MAG: hypothetical protein ACRD2L_24375 [Terriglobia bacterium]